MLIVVSCVAGVCAFLPTKLCGDARGLLTCRSSTGSTGIIIVDHGSRKKEANDMLTDVALAYRHYAKAPIVEPAHMELAEPSIRAAYQRCVEQGATHIVCHPFFLAPGRHVQEDIPRLLCEAAGDHPGVTYSITAPLGLQEGIVQLIDSAVGEAVSSGTTPPP